MQSPSIAWSPSKHYTQKSFEEQLIQLSTLQVKQRDAKTPATSVDFLKITKSFSQVAHELFVSQTLQLST